jgi:RNA polymerase sigma factor (sigma-70 family)
LQQEDLRDIWPFFSFLGGMDETLIRSLTRQATKYLLPHLGAEAEDAVQKVWAAIIARGPAVRQETFEAYFWKAVRNRLISELRERQRHKRLVPLDQVNLVVQPRMEAGRLLAELLATLPPNAGGILQLRAEGRDLGEIARAAGCNAKRVANVLYRTRRRLLAAMRGPAASSLSPARPGPLPTCAGSRCSSA